MIEANKLTKRCISISLHVDDVRLFLLENYLFFRLYDNKDVPYSLLFIGKKALKRIYLAIYERFCSFEMNGFRYLGICIHFCNIMINDMKWRDHSLFAYCNLYRIMHDNHENSSSC